MIEFGRTLSDARTAKGLTVSQIAEATHMMASIVKDLENENFTRIVAPIYGRGFVKLYCEAVGIDPKPLVAEFMEIYSGNRIPTIKERPVSTPAQEPEPAPEPVVEPIAPPVPPPANISPQPFAPPRPAPNVVPTAAEPPLSDFGPLFNPKPAPQTAPRPQSHEEPALPPEQSREPRLSRYASPLHEHSEPKPQLQLPSCSIPPSVWRIAVLVLVAAGILWGLFIGIRMLYRVTNDLTPQTVRPEEPQASEPAVATPEPTAPVRRETAPVETKKPVKAQAIPAVPKQTPKSPKSERTGRTPQKIPPLYLD